MTSTPAQVNFWCLCCRASDGFTIASVRTHTQQHPFHMYSHHCWFLTSGYITHNSPSELSAAVLQSIRWSWECSCWQQHRAALISYDGHHCRFATSGYSTQNSQFMFLCPCCRAAGGLGRPMAFHSTDLHPFHVWFWLLTAVPVLCLHLQ